MTLIIGQFTTLYNVWFSEFPSSITILLGNLLNYTLVIFFANFNKIFHKTEVQTYILRCWKVLNHKWFKSYNIITKKRKKHQKRKKKKKTSNKRGVFYKFKKTGIRNVCILGHNFGTKYDSDLFRTSKWLLKTQFCERYYVASKKMTGKVVNQPFISRKFWWSVSIYLFPG